MTVLKEFVIIPDEQELRDRIAKHLEADPGNERVALAWRAYLAGIAEFGLLNDNFYREILQTIPDSDFPELWGIAVGHETE